MSYSMVTEIVFFFSISTEIKFAFEIKNSLEDLRIAHKVRSPVVGPTV